MLNVNSKVNILDTGVNPFNIGIKEGTLYDNKTGKNIFKVAVGMRKYQVTNSFNSYKKGDIIYCLHVEHDSNYYFSHNKDNDNLFDEALQYNEFNNNLKSM